MMRSPGSWGWVARLLPVDRARQIQAVRAFTLFALFMGSYYVLKPARGSLYIHYLGARNLPYVYLVSAAIALGFMYLYDRARLRFGPAKLITGSLWILVASALAFFVAYETKAASPELLSFLFFVWVSLYAVVAPTLFWSLANDVFEVETSRRVYGVVGAGGFVGAFAGSELAARLVAGGWVRTEGLIPLGAGLLLLTVPVIRGLRGGSGASRPVAPAREARDGLSWIVKDAYVAAMAGLVLVMTFVGTLFDLQYQDVLEAAIPGKEEKTAYLGSLYAAVNLIGFLTQILVTGPVNRRFGPLPGLIAYPSLGIAAALVLLLTPTLTGVTIVWTLGLATMYSIHQSSKELLYVPTPRGVKYGAKGYIDVFCFRLGDGVASVLALAWRELLSLAVLHLSLVCLALLPGWWLLALFLGRRYSGR